jgi:apolipoprotein N-acyltransferase
MALAVAISIAGGGLLLLPSAEGGRSGSTIGLVQGNILGERKWDRTRQGEILADFISLSRETLSENPDLIIWPETATGSYLRRDPIAFSIVQGFADSSGVPIIAGYPDWRPLGADDYEGFNAAGLFLPGVGLARQYNKINLVPFGERLPFQWALPFLGKLDLGQAEWTPGDSLVLMPTASDTAAVLICFESSLSEMSREARQRGANLLVVITNDEWFGRTGALYQHAAMSSFRAVETRLPVARCANTGLSFFVDTAGRIYDQGGIFTREVRVARVDRPGPITPYVRFGDVLGWGLLVASGILLVVTVLSRKRRF